MLIVMKPDATEEQIESVVRRIEEHGLQPHVMPGQGRTAIGITGNRGALNPAFFDSLPGVYEALAVTKSLELTTLDRHPEKTIVRVGDVKIGDGELAIIAGPCAIENHSQAFTIAETVRRAGVKLFRGGAFKPRTSPHSFQGLGEEGLQILAEVRDVFGLKIVTEAMDERGLDMVERYADVIQIGARNMQNFPLLRRAGKSHLPVLLKRGMAATLDEFLLAAEYIMVEGNTQIVLCERGIRTFAQHTRNTLDLAIVPAIRRLSHLPVIVDPSHGTGKAYMVAALARAGVAVGADGLMLELHDHPEQALSDGEQALTLDAFNRTIEEVRVISEALHPVTAAG